MAILSAQPVVECSKKLPSNFKAEQKEGKYPMQQEELILRPPTPDISEEQVYEVVMSSPKLSTKKGILSFADDCNLDVKISSKDSKARAARKLARAIALAAPRHRVDVIGALIKGHDSQTQGWVEVIRKRR